jgi:hypothetical protein
MSLKNILLTALVVVLAFSIVGYIFYVNLKKNDGDPFLLIPENSAVVLQVDNPGKVFGKMLADTTVWESLTQIETFKKLESDILHFGAFLHDKPAYFDLLNNSPLLISFHPGENDQSNQVLFLSKMGIVPFRSDIKTFLEQYLGNDYAVSDYEADGFNGFQVGNTITGKSFFFVFIDGVMVTSSEKGIIEKALKTYAGNKAHFSQDKAFVKLRNTSGDKVDARLFIHYRYFGQLLKIFTNKNVFESMNWLDKFAAWSEVDLTIKNNKILLNGFTSVGKSGDTFLGHFANQKGSEDKTINLLPFNTNFAVRQGFSDYNAYYKKYVKPKISKTDKAYANKISPLVGEEVCLASNASSEQEFDDKTWAIIRLKNKTKGRQVLKALADKLKGGNIAYFEGNTIRQIQYDRLLSSLFGKAFSVIKNNYFIFEGDFVVFANSPDGLINLLQHYKTGKTLDLSESFKAFSDNLSTTANISLYVNPQGIINLLPKFLNDKMAIGFMENATAIARFKGLSFQYSRSESGMFYTSFYLNHGSAVQSDNISQWKVGLTDEIVGQPYLVRDHTTNKYNVIVFDKSANMYLISTDGRMLWQKRIDQLPLSSINEVDFFKNGKIQYLFNTADFVYLIDKNGEMVKNYPKKLNPSATNGLKLFDYNNNKNYRLLISLADKWTYDYTIRGRQVTGWAKPRMNNMVR